jgi:GAF domain-containing protein
MTDTYPIPFDEALRLKVLESYAILDSEAEEEFSSLCDLVSRYFRVPTVLISLVGRDRQWFKCHHGLPETETPRNLAFYNYTILGSEVFCVLDASQDPRFKDNKLVTRHRALRRARTLRGNIGMPTRHPK